MAKQMDMTYAATSSGETISSVITVTSGGLIINIDETIPPSSTDLQFAIAFAYAKLKAYCIRTSAAMTLQFNNSTTGVPELSMAAGQATNWHDTDPHANLFTANVTTLYVTSSAGGTLRAMFLVDPT